MTKEDGERLSQPVPVKRIEESNTHSALVADLDPRYPLHSKVHHSSKACNTQPNSCLESPVVRSGSRKVVILQANAPSPNKSRFLGACHGSEILDYGSTRTESDRVSNSVNRMCEEPCSTSREMEPQGVVRSRVANIAWCPPCCLGAYAAVHDQRRSRMHREVPIQRKGSEICLQVI